MSRLFLSVLLPFKDAERYLAESLQSICNQSHADFELIAVNDHSSDKSLSIIKTFQKETNDGRIKILNNPGHGLVSALNFGISQSRSEYIVRMDSDDIMVNSRLKKLAAYALENPKTELIASQVEVISNNEVTDGFNAYIQWQNDVLTQEQIVNQIFIESPFAHPSVMYKKTTIENIGGYHQGDFPEDYELWIRMVTHNCQMMKIPEKLLCWRDSEDRLSRNDSIYRRAAFDQLRADYLKDDSRLTKAARVVFWGAGRITRQRCKRLISQGIEPIKWIDIDPKKIGNYLNGVEVVAADWLIQQNEKPFVLVYVANHGARENIEEFLNKIGYTVGENYLCVG